MRYVALATDYDGTLAADGKVGESTKAALERFRDSGRRLILVTGRQLDDLLEVFPEVELFDWVVAENGALLYQPSTKESKALGEAPRKEFLDALSRKGVPFSVGRVIVATWEPHEAAVLEAIKDLGLELQVIFNKGAVMVLPEGLNKAAGLTAVLDEMGLSPHNVVGVGDAENDHAFLKLCECSVAVGQRAPDGERDGRPGHRQASRRRGGGADRAHHRDRPQGRGRRTSGSKDPGGCAVRRVEGYLDKGPGSGRRG